jgi:PcfJ-like protein
MGKSNKLRQARRQQAERSVCAVLEAHSRRKTEPAVAVSYGDFAPSYRAKIEAWRPAALRRPEDWRCRLKSRSQERRFLDLVRFTFARYPAPAHLEQVWIRDVEDDFVDHPALSLRRAGAGHRATARPDLRGWYLVATQGGSLHKQLAHPYLTKLETHHFLNAPGELPSERAFWYAVARAQSEDGGSARKVALTRLVDYSIASSFWREAARFFARNPTTIEEMNDLIDFIRAAKEEDEGFALKGRTLPALRRRMEEWHRALRKQQAICGGSWAGAAIPDVEYRAGREENPAIWRLRQIKTGNDLFREGQRMHHCVAGYKFLCARGDVSIWSLTCEHPLGHVNKGVTIELRRDGAIVQCRGFANRLPFANEAAMVKRWAREHGLSWQALER